MSDNIESTPEKAIEKLDALLASGGVSGEEYETLRRAMEKPPLTSLATPSDIAEDFEKDAPSAPKKALALTSLWIVSVAYWVIVWMGRRINYNIHDTRELMAESLPRSSPVFDWLFSFWELTSKSLWISFAFWASLVTGWALIYLLLLPRLRNTKLQVSLKLGRNISLIRIGLVLIALAIHPFLAVLVLLADLSLFHQNNSSPENARLPNPKRSV